MDDIRDVFCRQVKAYPKINFQGRSPDNKKAAPRDGYVMLAIRELAFGASRKFRSQDDCS
jgi:hypothetical protein